MTEKGAGHSISMFSSMSLLTIAEEIVTRNNFRFLFTTLLQIVSCTVFILCYVLDILKYFNKWY